MSKKRLFMVELEPSDSADSLNHNRDFIFHLQDSLLLALLEQSKLTRYQYEWCIGELRRLYARDR